MASDTKVRVRNDSKDKDIIAMIEMIDSNRTQIRSRESDIRKLRDLRKITVEDPKANLFVDSL